jgi:WD40 repeat protein
MMKRQYMNLICALLYLALCLVGFPTVNLYAQEQDGLSSIRWSPNGEFIAGGYSSGTLRVWNASTGEILMEVQGRPNSITDVAWSPDGLRLASTNAVDAFVQVWNVADSSLVTELNGEAFNGGVAYVAWNPRGTMLASIVFSETSPLRIWSVQGDQFELLPISDSFAAFDLEWSPDGNQLAVASFNGVFTFNAFSPENFVKTNVAPPALHLAWSPDSLHLAASDMEGLIYLVNTQTAQTISTMQGRARDNEHGISTLAWSPDGQRLAVDDWDGTIQIWDTATSTLLESYSLSRQGSRNLITWSPYGGRLALGNAAPVVQAQMSQAAVDMTVATADFQIIVPLPSLETLSAVQSLCMTPEQIREVGTPAVEQLGVFEQAVEQAASDSIPSACAADLLALTEALETQP